MSRIKNFAKNKIFVFVIIIVIVLLGFIILGKKDTTNTETIVANIQDVTQKVEVSGKVLPIEKTDLSFGKSGIVKIIKSKIGDPIKKGDLIASLDDADDGSSLLAYQASYMNAIRGLRPEEIEYEKSKLDAAKTSYDNAMKSALLAARDGYTKTQSAFVNYVDSFFTNPQSVNPTITIRTQAQSETSNINELKLKSNEILLAWKNDTESKTGLNTSEELISNSHKYLDKIKEFMNLITTIVNNISPGNSGVSQSTIDGYTSTLNGSLSAFNSAYSSVIDAESSLRSAKSALDEANKNYTLKMSGSSRETIEEARARVSQAQALVSKNKIYSPIDGILTKSEPNVGEYVNAGEIVFGVMSNSAFKIETNVTEADISKVHEGDHAAIKLDAYGDDVIFYATIKTIDPAETIVEGVPTYKVTLYFDTPDERIRSGMTANTEIDSGFKENVVAIPVRSIYGTDGKRSVKILSSDGKTYETRPISIGLRGSDGMIEIISGLSGGEKLLIQK